MTEQFMENISNEEHERLLLLCGHSIGPSLSPAAQAVLDAAADVYWDWSDMSPASSSIIAAAALRAAADQVISPLPPPCEDFDEYAQGFLAAHVKYRAELLAIANELEELPND